MFRGREALPVRPSKAPHLSFTGVPLPSAPRADFNFDVGYSVPVSDTCRSRRHCHRRRGICYHRIVDSRFPLRAAAPDREDRGGRVVSLPQDHGFTYEVYAPDGKPQARSGSSTAPTPARIGGQLVPATSLAGGLTPAALFADGRWLR